MSDIILPGEETNVNLDEGNLAERVKELKEKLGLTDEAAEARVNPENEEAPEIKGSDIDWNDYQLEENWAHFYPKAVLKNTPNGPKWVVKITEFLSESKAFNNRNISEKNKEPLGLGEYLTFMVNGPENWQIGSILPNGTSMAGVVLHRSVMIQLPDPIEIIKPEVETPTDEEIINSETVSLEWAQKEGENDKP